MLMQLAAATAAKGTKRPMIGGKCYQEGKDDSEKREIKILTAD